MSTVCVFLQEKTPLLAFRVPVLAFHCSRSSARVPVQDTHRLRSLVVNEAGLFRAAAGMSREAGCLKAFGWTPPESPRCAVSERWPRFAGRAARAASAAAQSGVVLANPAHCVWLQGLLWASSPARAR